MKALGFLLQGGQGLVGTCKAKPRPQPCSQAKQVTPSCDVPIVSHQSDRRVAYQSSEGETVARVGNEPRVVPDQTHHPTWIWD